MGDRAERGTTLVEAVVAVGIFALLAGAALQALLFSARSAGADAVPSAMRAAVEREMALARDAAKYEGATLTPQTVSTAIPMPAGTPLPVRLSLEPSPQPNGSLSVTISATSPSGESVSLRQAFPVPAPLPGTKVVQPGLAPQPTGAP